MTRPTDHSSERSRHVTAETLGGYANLANDVGALVGPMSFDAWGQRRNTSNWQGPPASLPTTTTGGYTNQEDFDQFGLIHYRPIR